MEAMPQLSASTLKLFQECPRCFWLHVNSKLERPRGPFPSLPSGIDRVLKAYFERYRHQGALPPLIRGKLDGKLGTAVLTLGFNDAQASARLWGKLDDCVVLSDGRLAPLDHKTRACAPDDVSYSEQYYKFQMDVYALLLERNGYPTSRTAYVVYYCPVDGTLHDGFPFGVTVHTLTTEPERAYDTFRAACRCLSGPVPPSSLGCDFCRWLDARSRLPAEIEPQAKAQAMPSPVKRSSRAATRARKPSPAISVPDDLFA
ncbi:MAG: hypothetical protein COV75_01365 [Candidatus Omnitrophica bacterium CG11_big_fil_rev_8_21_14_0_20_63_9]|nr:MAG: hypothetical protein COV75_01365 [Candidatus Omnitrophica bacterium CG11_big_fil_rev_8_21_14_0_20_63_9]